MEKNLENNKEDNKENNMDNDMVNDMEESDDKDVKAEGRTGLKCPCCGNYTIDPDEPEFDICPVCFWENDPYQEKFPEETGANNISLNEARKNYEEFGACEKRLVKYVRKPEDDEIAKADGYSEG